MTPKPGDSAGAIPAAVREGRENGRFGPGLEPCIEVRNLTKRFGSFTAVDGISFTVRRGEIFGFLGPNGAGKSTTIRMLCGILKPTAGEGRVAGFSVASEPEKIKKIIGYMSQRFTLYGDLTVGENIDFHGGIHRLSPARMRERKEWVLCMAGLKGRENALTAELSGGWKQRLALGCAIIHGPRVVFLDEPTASVDPVSRRDFWDLIYGMSEAGTTAFVTSHYMDEVERCHRIAIIFGGRIIALGTPRELKAEFVGRPSARLEDVFIAAVRKGGSGVRASVEGLRDGGPEPRECRFGPEGRGTNEGREP